MQTKVSKVVSGTNKKGFTLLELLAVLVIIAALAVIAIPIFMNKSDEAKQVAHNETVRTLQKQAQTYIWEEQVSGEQENIIADMKEKGYIKEIPDNPIKEGVGAGVYVVRIEANGSVTVTPGIVPVTGIISGEAPPEPPEEGDTTPPTIALAKTGGNVTSEEVTATITDASAIAIKKWASGTQNIAYFAGAGTAIADTTFEAIANGIYTIYAKDAAGNEAVQTIDIENIVTIAEGKYIKFGSYLGQPIVWRVIHKEDKNGDGLGDLMLLSDKIISMKPYDAKDPAAPSTDGCRDDYGSNYWANSNIREWLNSTEATVAYSTQKPDADHVSVIGTAVNPYDTEAGFLTNFTANERNQVISVAHKSIVDNDNDGHDGGTAEHGYVNTGVDESVSVGAGANYNTAYYRNTTDKIFLPSLGELAEYVDGVLTYPSTTDYQIGYTTLQARNQSNYASDPANDTTAWYYWIRDAYAANSSGGRHVNTNGAVDSSNVYLGYEGVRPACILSSSSMTLDESSGADESEAYTILSFN